MIEPRKRRLRFRRVDAIAAQQFPRDGERAWQIEVIVHAIGEAANEFRVRVRGWIVRQAEKPLAHPREPGRRGVERLPREVELTPIVSGQAKIAIREWIEAAVD